MNVVEANVLSIVPKPDYEVYNAIQSFLESAGVESNNTKVTYETAIKDFFKATRSKSLYELSRNDLVFSYIDIEKYRNGLIGTLKNASINIKMIAIKKLFDKLVKYEMVQDSKPFEMHKLKEHDIKSYDSMSIEEVRKCIEVVEDSKNGFEKGLLIRLAFVTGFRKHALMTLKFANITTLNGQNVIKVLDKGNKWSTKKLDDELYEEIIQYKEIVNRDNIFNLSNTTVQRMMKLINNKVDFGDRYITFHSFKKASIEEVAIQTNYDIKAMQYQGNHADVTTTLNVYLAKKTMDNMPTISLTSNEPDLSSLKDLTKDDLYDIISKLDRQTQIQVLELANKK